MAANNNTNNPFSFETLFAGFSFPKNPGFMPTDIISKNIATFSAASKLMYDSMQEISKRQQQLMKESIEDYTNAMNDVFSAAAPEKKIEKNTAIAKKNFEKSVANVKDVTEILAKSNRDVLQLFTKRTTEVMSEAKGAVKK
jgi:phasin family protein